MKPTLLIFLSFLLISCKTNRGFLIINPTNFVLKKGSNIKVRVLYHPQKIIKNVSYNVINKDGGLLDPSKWIPIIITKDYDVKVDNAGEIKLNLPEQLDVAGDYCIWKLSIINPVASSVIKFEPRRIFGQAPYKKTIPFRYDQFSATYEFSYKGNYSILINSKDDFLSVEDLETKNILYDVFSIQTQINDMLFDDSFYKKTNIQPNIKQEDGSYVTTTSYKLKSGLDLILKENAKKFIEYRYTDNEILKFYYKEYRSQKSWKNTGRYYFKENKLIAYFKDNLYIYKDNIPYAFIDFKSKIYSDAQKIKEDKELSGIFRSNLNEVPNFK